MSDLAILTAKLAAAREQLESLAAGYTTDATAPDVAAFLEEVQALAQFMDDEAAEPFVGLDTSEIEDVVDYWFETADKVAARRGEA